MKDEKPQKTKIGYKMGMFFLLTIAISLPILFYAAQNKQTTKSKAAETCGNATTDTVIIIDRSGSMGIATKLPPTKTAAKNFIDIISKDTRNRISLVSFASTASLDSPLTTNYGSVKTKIDSLKAEGHTCIECAIKLANDEIAAHGRPGIKKVVVLLSDGYANWIIGGKSEVSTTIADQKAMAMATAGYKASKTQFFTIALGNSTQRDFNPELLKKIASLTAGKFYFPLPSELNSVYNDISLLIGKGIVSGFVFNDTNRNGVYDTNETKIPSWTINLISSSTTKSVKTDSTGAFAFTNLCDGTYTVKQITKTGWQQTMPANNKSYSVTILNAFSVPDRNFGVAIVPPTPTPLPTKAPTSTPIPTPTPGITTLSLTLLLDGIGNRGDNTNPEDGSLSNKNPLHPIIKSDVQVYDMNNKLIASAAGVVTYNKTLGNFQGSFSLERAITTVERYNIKVKASRYLRRLAPGIQIIKPGQNNEIVPITLVAGDINNDNKITLTDYNLLIDCYSDLKKALNCSSEEKKIVADINDDGFVNHIDYNLFIREISTQPGN